MRKHINGRCLTFQKGLQIRQRATVAASSFTMYILSIVRCWCPNKNLCNLCVICVLCGCTFYCARLRLRARYMFACRDSLCQPVVDIFSILLTLPPICYCCSECVPYYLNVWMRHIESTTSRPRNRIATQLRARFLDQNIVELTFYQIYIHTILGI